MLELELYSFIYISTFYGHIVLRNLIGVAELTIYWWRHLFSGVLYAICYTGQVS